MPFGHTFVQTRDWSDLSNPWKETEHVYNCQADWDTPLDGNNPGEFINVSQKNHAYVIHHFMGARSVPYNGYVKLNVYKDSGNIYIEVETYSVYVSPNLRNYTFRVNNLATPIQSREKFRVSRLTLGFWPLADSYYEDIPFSMEWYNDDEETPDGEPYSGEIGVGWTLDMLEFQPVARFPFFATSVLIDKSWHVSC